MKVLERQMVSLSDIALLARVQRAAVTTWRARHADRTYPFPLPASVFDGRDLFDVDEVLDWLEITGCGNNPDARQDAVAFTLAMADVAADDVLFAGLGALICLRGATGRLASDVEELLDAAEQFDGDDELLVREVEAVGAQLEPLARYAELLVENALDPSEPFDELVRQRQLGSGRPPVHRDLRRLVARAAIALADEAGFSSPTLVVRTPKDVDLVIEAVAQTERRGPLSVAVTLTAAELGSASARLARRWLHVHGITQSQVEADPDGDYQLPDESVLILRLLTAGTDREADLGGVSNLCLNLSSHNRAVVVGPSASLTDALLVPRGPGRPAEDGTRLSQAGELRRDALRTNAVRAIVRLPQGLFPEQSRSRAAIWCLGPNQSAPSSTLCADLTQRLVGGAGDDLLTDLTAAMQGPGGGAARQLSTARFRPTTDLSTSTHDLVAPVVREVHLRSAPVLRELEEVLGRAATAVPGITPATLIPTVIGALLPRMSLDRAVRERKIRLIAGARIGSAGTNTRGTVPVVQHPTDLQRRDKLPALTEFELATAYPRAERTEPGDVVVSSVGGPAAVVDRLGGAVVAFPARVLRCHRPRPSTAEERAELARQGRQLFELTPQSFTPEAVAANINAQPSSLRDWKAWALTVLPADQIVVTERLLSELAERRDHLDQAHTDTDIAIRTLTQAVGAQICTVSPPGLSSTLERIVV